MTKSVVVCDECGTLKKESNNWHRLCVYYTHKIFSNAGFPVFADGVKQPKDMHVLDLCGQACLINVISNLLKEEPCKTKEL